jgi:hypothetical protein
MEWCGQLLLPPPAPTPPQVRARGRISCDGIPQRADARVTVEMDFVHKATRNVGVEHCASFSNVGPHGLLALSDEPVGRAVCCVGPITANGASEIPLFVIEIRMVPGSVGKSSCKLQVVVCSCERGCGFKHKGIVYVQLCTSGCVCIVI